VPRSLRRLLIGLVALLSVTTALAVPAGAAPIDDARLTVTRFLDAWAVGDGKAACALVSDRAKETIGGEKACEGAFTPSTSSTDAEAVLTLQRGYFAAMKSAAKRKGKFVTKTFKIAKLAADMQRLDPELDVVVGTGPQSAAGQFVTTLVIDKRTTSRRLVAYVESDSGTILRLSTTYKGDPSVSEAGQGIPEMPAGPSEPQFTYTLDTFTALSESRFYVEFTLRSTEDSSVTVSYALVVAKTGEAWFIDDLLLSVFALVSEGD
jgi:hypothetical protein